MVAENRYTLTDRDWVLSVDKPGQPTGQATVNLGPVLAPTVTDQRKRVIQGIRSEAGECPANNVVALVRVRCLGCIGCEFVTLRFGLR